MHPFGHSTTTRKNCNILRCNPWAVGWSPEGTFSAFCIGKIGQNTLTPHSSATVCRREKVTWSWNLPDAGTTTWSKQYLSVVHPVTCSLLLSEVPVWPTFDFSFWGQMTPKSKNFWKCLSGFRDRIPNYVSWPNFVKSAVAKLPKARLDYHKKARTLRDLFQPLFCPKLANHTKNSLIVVTLWHVNIYRIWSGSAAICRTYSGKIDFSPPQVIIYVFSLQ